MKTCRDCKLEKDESEFSVTGKDSKFLNVRCKPCQNKFIKNLPLEERERRKATHKEYYLKNKEKVKARTSAYQKANRQVNRKATKKYRVKMFEAYIAYKKTCKCLDCGNIDYRCLEFHHVDPSVMKDRICNIYNSPGLLEQELKKCIVLCANCHSIRHYGERHAVLIE